MFHDIILNMALRQKFATQVDPQLLAQMKAIAEAEGRQLQSVVEEALRDLVEKKQNSKPRTHVMAAHQASLEVHDTLYERLSK